MRKDMLCDAYAVQNSDLQSRAALAGVPQGVEVHGHAVTRLGAPHSPLSQRLTITTKRIASHTSLTGLLRPAPVCLGPNEFND